MLCCAPVEVSRQSLKVSTRQHTPCDFLILCSMHSVNFTVVMGVQIISLEVSAIILGFGGFNYPLRLLVLVIKAIDSRKRAQTKQARCPSLFATCNHFDIFLSEEGGSQKGVAQVAVASAMTESLLKEFLTSGISVGKIQKKFVI